MINLIIQLLPLVPNLIPVLIHVVAQIKSQGGMTTDEIFARSSAQLDENEQKLLEDLKRLGAL